MACGENIPKLDTKSPPLTAELPFPSVQLSSNPPSRPHNSAVPSTSAQIPRQSFFYVFICGMRVFFEQCFKRNDHSGRTVAALEAAFFQESGLAHIQFFYLESFDGCDGVAVCLIGHRHARIGQLPVN